MRVDQVKSDKMKRDEVLEAYRKQVVNERKKRRQEGYKGKEVHEGPISRMGPEAYWTIVCEMARDPILKGLNGAEMDEPNTWANWFVKHIEDLNQSIGEAKMAMLTDSMDFMRL